MFNITSKYFSFFNNKPPASRVAHITRDFLACYFCPYYSSMLQGIMIMPSSLNKFDFVLLIEILKITKRSPQISLESDDDDEAGRGLDIFHKSFKWGRRIMLKLPSENPLIFV